MKKVKIKIDMEHRNKLRRLHTATHVVNFCARQILGNHVWQNGSNLKPEFGTLDITHYDNLSQEEIFQIERLVNETIFADKKVTVEELPRSEAEKKYGFVLYQGGAIPMKTLRVVKIVDSDIEACGGIHMDSTGGIGFVKIIDSSKIQDGVVRLKYVVRDFAISHIEDTEKLVSGVCEVFSVGKESIIKTSEKFFNEWKSQRKEIDKLKDEIKSTKIDMILGSGDSNFEMGDMDMGQLIEIFTSCTSKKKNLVLKSDKFVVCSDDFKLPSFKKEINKGKFKVYVL